MISPFWSIVANVGSKLPYLNRLFSVLNQQRTDLDQHKLEIERLRAGFHLLSKDIEKIQAQIAEKVQLTDYGYCTVCGESNYFYKEGSILREAFICENCHSSSRNRHLAKILCETFMIREPYSLEKFIGSLSNLSIYEAQASGPIHDKLKSLNNYQCSEFFEGITSGSLSSDGTLCQDLQSLSFANNSFDLVVTQDVFEHVRNPEIAWREVYRVLKPGGYHVFTIPWFNKDHKTVKRVRVAGETEVFILPKVFHGDYIRDGLVYSDFGYDLLEELDTIGFSTQVFYNTDQDSKLYRIYWSSVFVSQKV